MTRNYKSRLLAYGTLIRPSQWIKNGFVLAPLLFSGQFTDFGLSVKTGLTFVSFCLISSAAYAFNDVCDFREDQQHPVKRFRPIASGVVAPHMAIFLAVALTPLSVALAWYVSWYVALVVILYAVTHLAYSLTLKHVAILEMMIISAGFVLRNSTFEFHQHIVFRFDFLIP